MLAMLNISQKPFQYATKLIADKLIAFFSILFATPLLILISFAIKIDSKGPVLFKQKRLGYRGKEFHIFKFRTMKSDAEDIRNPDGTTFNAEDDLRQTKLGRLLRASSLDEVPQLLNVLRGEMSLVGPRPDLPEFLDKYNGVQIRKLDVLPGITGMAQVNGRNEIPLVRRFEYDVYYVENFTLFLDITIIIKTIYNVLRGRGVFVQKNG